MSGAVRLWLCAEGGRGLGRRGGIRGVLSAACLPAPHDHSTAETHRAHPDVFDACFTPVRDGLLDRMTLVVLGDRGAEEPADLRPLAPAGGESGRREHRARVSAPGGVP